MSSFSTEFCNLNIEINEKYTKNKEFEKRSFKILTWKVRFVQNLKLLKKNKNDMLNLTDFITN